MVPVETAYETSGNSFGFNVRKVLKDRAFPKAIRDHHAVHEPVTGGELSDEVYGNVPP